MTMSCRVHLEQGGSLRGKGFVLGLQVSRWWERMVVRQGDNSRNNDGEDAFKCSMRKLGGIVDRRFFMDELIVS